VGTNQDRCQKSNDGQRIVPGEERKREREREREKIKLNKIKEKNSIVPVRRGVGKEPRTQDWCKEMACPRNLEGRDGSETQLGLVGTTRSQH
jgi:hypothetical protein